MQIPPYFKQEKQATCSLAVLRMALAHFKIDVTESELEEKVRIDYGNNFKNIRNELIAKIAIEYGLNTKTDKNLTKEKLRKLVEENSLIQTSIKLHYMYPDDNTNGFHSILIYGIENNTVSFHDPYRGKGLNVTANHLLKAATNVGVFMSYKNIT